MSLSKGIDEQSASARSDRRYTSGQVTAVDNLQHTCTVDVGATDVQGNPIYLPEVSFQPQSPPTPGDWVTLIYTSRSAHSIVVAGSQLSGQNGQSTITAVGAKIAVEVSGGAPVGPEANLNFIPGTNVSSISAADDAVNGRIDITINASGGSAPHALLDGSMDSDTLAHAPTAGDLIVANGTPKWAGLGIGAAGEVLTVVSGAPAWAAPSGGSGGNWAETTVSGTTTVVSSGPESIMCNNASAGFTVSLPSGAGVSNMYAIRREHLNSNQITISVNSGGTIEGTSTLLLGAFIAAYGTSLEAVIIQSDGSDYKILGALQSYTGAAVGPVVETTLSVTANYTVVGTDVNLSADATAGAFGIQFPAPSSANAGRLVRVRKSSSGSNTVNCFCSPSVGMEFEAGLSGWIIGTGGQSANFAEFICTDEAGTYTWRAFSFG